MKSRYNLFLAKATLAATTIMIAGQQHASAEAYNIDTFTGGTFLWPTETIWNPDAGVGTGPVGTDTIAISGDLITAATNINYATGTAANRAITSINVEDTLLTATQSFNFQPGVAESKLEFATSTPGVATTINNVASGGQRLMVQNPWFTQASTVFTKGGTGNVLLDFVATDTIAAFNTNVTSLTSSTGGTLRLNGPVGGSVSLPDVTFSANTRLTLSGASPFSATGKTINLGTGELSIGAGGSLTLGTGTGFTIGPVIMSSGNSGHFYMGGNSTVTVDGATGTFASLNMGDQLNGNGTVTVNMQSGTASVLAAGFLGNPNTDGTITETLALNVSGGLLDFTSATNVDFNVGRNTRTNVAAQATASTANGTVTVSGGELDLSNNTRLVLGLRTATNFAVGNANGVLNLNGGVLKTGREIARGTIGTSSVIGAGPATTNTSAKVFLNGGTLFTNAAIANLFTAFTGATDGIFVSSGGAVIDTNGFDSGTATVLQQNTASPGGSLTKNGTGILTLGAANTFTGDTKINAGTLLLTNSLALQNSTFDSDGAGTLGFGGLTAATFGGLKGAGSLVLENTTPAALALTVGGTQNSSYSGSLSGAGSLTKAGAGMLTLSGTNSYAGNTAINGGVLAITTTAALPGFDTAARYSVANGATLAVGNSVSDGDITTILGTTNLLAGARLGFDTTAGNRSYGNDVGGALGLTKIGENKLTLTNAQTYTGATTLYQGTLALTGASTTLPATTALAFLGGAILDLGGNSQTVANLTTGGGTYSAAATNGSLTVASTGNLNFTPAQTINGQAVTLNLSGLSSFTYNNPTKEIQVGGGGTYGNTLDLSLSAGTNSITAITLFMALGGNGTLPFNGGILRLGSTNILHVGDGVGNDFVLSGYRSSGNQITFIGDPAASTLEIRAADGTSRTGGIAVSTGSSGTSAANPITASFDLGIVDALVGDIVLADTVQTGTGPTVIGTMTMAGGKLDATSMVLGRVNVGVTVPTNVNTLSGTFTQSGGTAIINTLTMGNVIAGTQVTVNQPVFTPTYTLGDGAVLKAAVINANPAGGVFRNTSSRNLVINGGTLANVAGGNLTVSGADASDAGLLNVVLGGTNNTFEASSGQTIDIQATAPVSGTGNLVKTGLGTLSLKSANTYSGETLVNAGTLEIATDDTLADGYAVRLASGTTLNLTFTGEDTVDRLFINGVAQPSGTWGSLASSATHKSALITGDGILAVTNGSAVANNFATWASLNGVTGGPNGDSDNDGIRNLVEYALADGTRGTLTGNTLSFTKRGAPWGGDITYDIETSSTLASWTTLAKPPVTETAGSITYLLPTGAGKIFARLKVVEIP